MAGALGRIGDASAEMIDAMHALPICRQAELLDISRSNAHYLPKPTSEPDLALMRRIDELHLVHPFAGARMLRDMLNREGIQVGRKHVGTLMDKMGIAAIYRKRNTSAPHPEAHPVYPYLLKNLTSTGQTRSGATDITHIPMRRGFVYLVAILDWATQGTGASSVDQHDWTSASRRWRRRLPGTVRRRLHTDQGSQFTSADFTRVLTDNSIQISMDGKGRWVDKRLRRAALAQRRVRARPSARV